MSPERAVEEVLARYVRAADQLNGTAIGELFAPEGQVEGFQFNGGSPESLFALQGREAIATAMTNLMAPHPARGWSHHTTHGHLVAVTGDHATIDAQFIRFDTVGAERPATGWPAGVMGLLGNITPTEAGYYQTTLRKENGAWLIINHRILHNMTFALPA